MSQDIGEFILCADDYGMTRGIDQAILALAEEGRVSAVSCIVNGYEWSRSAEGMRKLVNIEVGLHVVLTDGVALTGAATPVSGAQLPTQWYLAWRAFSRRIDRAKLAREI